MMAKDHATLPSLALGTARAGASTMFGLMVIRPTMCHDLPEETIVIRVNTHKIMTRKPGAIRNVNNEYRILY